MIVGTLLSITFVFFSFLVSLFGNVRNRVPSKGGGLVKLDKTQSVERAEDNNYKKIHLRK